MIIIVHPSTLIHGLTSRSPLVVSLQKQFPASSAHAGRFWYEWAAYVWNTRPVYCHRCGSIMLTLHTLQLFLEHKGAAVPRVPAFFSHELFKNNCFRFEWKILSLSVHVCIRWLIDNWTHDDREWLWSTWTCISALYESTPPVVKELTAVRLCRKVWPLSSLLFHFNLSSRTIYIPFFFRDQG